MPAHLTRQQEVEAVVDPTAEHVTGDQEGVLDSDHQTASMRCGDLRLDDGHCHGEKTNAQSLDGTTGDESVEARGEHLHEGGPEVDESTNADASLTADDIAKSASDESSDCCGDLLRARNQQCKFPVAFGSGKT